MPLEKNNFKKKLTIIALVATISLPSSISYGALGDRTLSSGVNHEDVKTLQMHLKDMGYFKNNSPTNYYGKITVQAVRDFQAKNKLTVDGLFGPTSFKKLNALIKNNNSIKNPAISLPIKENIKPIIKPLPSKPPTNKPVHTNPVGSIKNQLLYKRPLSISASGPDVKELQEALKTLGFLNIANTTTYFGSITEKALMDFQSSLKLSTDGIAGPSTYQSINKALSGVLKLSTPNRGEDTKNPTSEIINISKTYLNPKVPYLFGGNSFDGIDCSAFTMAVYEKVGIKIPRNSELQARVGLEIGRNNLKAGDLLIFSDTYKKGPSHVGIYLGRDEFIHVSTSNNGVSISKLTEKYYEEHFTFARRLY